MNTLINAAAPLAAAIAIIGFALPSYIGAMRQRGLGRGLVLIGLLGIFSLAFMTVAIKTSYPFGAYSFNEALGYNIAGLVPWTIVFAYPPLIMGSFWLASKCTRTPIRIVLTALFATSLHVVLDPGLARMSIWQWEEAGPFYGVPVMNFFGWFVGGLLAGWIIARVWGSEAPVRRSLTYSAFGITWFWAGVNLGLHQWIPGVVGLAIGLFMVFVMRVEKRRERSRRS